MIQDTVKEYGLESFTFGKVCLGDVAPRIGGVKVAIALTQAGRKKASKGGKKKLFREGRKEGRKGGRKEMGKEGGMKGGKKRRKNVGRTLGRGSDTYNQGIIDVIRRLKLRRKNRNSKMIKIDPRKSSTKCLFRSICAKVSWFSAILFQL